MTGRGIAAKTTALIEAAKAILEEIQPATVRAVCYRLFVAGVTENMSAGETQRVSKALVYARENGIIPWAHIVDDSRRASGWRTFTDLASYGEDVVRGYRKDFWNSQPERVEVWSEKGTIKGTIQPILEKYQIVSRIMRGYGGATAVHDAAMDSLDHDLPLNIIYVGDFDPSGLHMSEKDLPERLKRYGGNVEIHRIALTDRDCTPDLPSFDISTKNKDPRHAWFLENFGARCWELDAMPPPVLRGRLDRAIYNFIDDEAWEHCESVENAELESVRRFRWA